MSKKAFLLGFARRRGDAKAPYQFSLINFQNGILLPLNNDQEIMAVVSLLCSFSKADEYETAAADSGQLNYQLSLSFGDGEDFEEALLAGNAEAIDFAKETASRLWEKIVIDHNLKGERDEFQLNETPPEDVPWKETGSMIRQERLPLEIFEYFSATGVSDDSVCLPVDHEECRPRYDFEKDFTYRYSEIPEAIRVQYDIIDIDVARDASAAFPRMEDTVNSALRKIGAKKSEPVVISGAPLDPGCLDDSLMEFNNRVTTIVRR